MGFTDFKLDEVEPIRTTAGGTYFIPLCRNVICHNALCVALRLARGILIVRPVRRKGVRRHSSNAARENPCDTGFDTVRRFGCQMVSRDSTERGRGRG